MNNEILLEITTNILDGGYLDLEYLTNTIEEYKLAVDEIVESVEQDFWKEYVTQINYLIYIALTMVAQKFIEENEKLFEDKSNEFEIFTNYLDSHVYFEDEEVQREFEVFYY